MLTSTLQTETQAWNAETIDDQRLWYYPLSGKALSLLRTLAEPARDNPQKITSLILSSADRDLLRAELQLVLDALESGRGFAIIERLPIHRHSHPELQAMYWLIGQALGIPFEQNVQGTLLYDVRDTGQDVSQGARFSVTNSESTFHTDNAFGEVLDYVGLLCLKTAKSGGINQLISAYAVCDALSGEFRESFEILRRPFHFDRRGGVKDGESPTAEVPIIELNGGGVILRYLRYWIEVGHDKIGRPLTKEQLSALDTLDQVLRRKELMVEFALEEGQILFINNRWLLHNRTAFEDYPELERRRHLVRLWLRKD